MSCNRLQFNTSKTEVLFGCSWNRRQHQIPQCPVRVGKDFVTPSTAVRDLGIYVDCDASCVDAVVKTVSNCFAVLRTSNPQCPSLGHAASAVVIGDVARDLTLRLRQCNVGGTASPTEYSRYSMPQHGLLIQREERPRDTTASMM